MKQLAIVFVVLCALSAAAPALADEARIGAQASPSSVFPVPRDPWRSWGLRHDLPKHVGPPREPRRVFAEPAPVWVPKQWVWGGTGWVWWPGGWVR
jgi:hypothetical protein